MKKIVLIVLCLVVYINRGYSQENDTHYVFPNDPQVQQKLEWWQDLKFGLIIHWGPYSQWGVKESWTIVPKGPPSSQRKGHGAENYFTYLQNYEDLKKTFNPTRFNPERWASAAKEAGMRYVVFTTKHHDGFCMFDTHQTDYKITSSGCPFHSNPRANVTKEIFEAFRKKDFEIGAYFSKPDWHSPYFWWPYFPPLDRYPNYDEAKYPDRWQKFKDYTYNQIKELLDGEYGKVDILWLDGGWVRPRNSEVIKKHPRRNDAINMPRIATMARSLQPGILLVDRSVGGLYENYRTPEQQIPDHVLPYPWETCMTMGTSWSYKHNDTYKSSEMLIHLLIKIVARGGNFLLNVGPDGKGRWDPAVYQRLKDIGRWMNLNGEAIYSTEPSKPYAKDNIFFTQRKDHSASFAFYLADSTHKKLPDEVFIPKKPSRKKSNVFLLGNSNPLKWEEVDNGIVIKIPYRLQKNPPCQYAWVFKIKLR